MAIVLVVDCQGVQGEELLVAYEYLNGFKPIKVG